MSMVGEQFTSSGKRLNDKLKAAATEFLGINAEDRKKASDDCTNLCFPLNWLDEEPNKAVRVTLEA